MKRVIVTEGQNDILFLKELLPTKIYVDENKILFFDHESGDKLVKVKHAQKKCFDKFDSGLKRYEILAKSEGGKDKIITVIHHQLTNLCEKQNDPIMLIDLDKKPIESFTTKLKDTLSSTFQNIELSVNQNQLYDDDEITTHSMELLSHNTRIGQMYIIAFKISLEDVTGIEKHHTEDEKREKIKSYIKKGKIHKRFLEVLS